MKSHSTVRFYRTVEIQLYGKIEQLKLGPNEE